LAKRTYTCEQFLKNERLEKTTESAEQGDIEHNEFTELE
jgi:hypothetical protein